MLGKKRTQNHIHYIHTHTVFVSFIYFSIICIHVYTIFSFVYLSVHLTKSPVLEKKWTQ